MAGSMVYRLRVGAPNNPHMQRFRRAMAKIQAIRDKRGYNHIAGFHGEPNWYCWHHQRNQKNPRVRARLLLPWHRAYLWWLEQALQDAMKVEADGVALPWWDWTTQRGVPEAYAAETVGGEHNPLFDSHIRVSGATPVDRFTTRDPGSPSGLPSAARVERLLSQTHFSTFSDGLESIHDSVHGWIGGDMESLEYAAFDPIFFAHHSMIDRLWYVWQVRHGVRNIPPGLLDMELIPFGKRVGDVLDVESLGYEYAASATEISLGATT